MPDRLACDEAINLSKARLKVQDDDLRNGEVETTLAGIIPKPWGMQGGFAVVYKFRTKSDKVRALRCYLTPMKADIRYRYECIGTYFAAHVPEITAEFKFHSDGILIREPDPGKPEAKKLFSLIEMEWIEGTTLSEHIASLCQRHDQAALERLLQQWVELIQKLRQAHIAHSDLAGGNVMVRADGRLVLVDYDGVYIPDFQGLPGIVEGQADYQHPEAALRPFDEEGDNFSALLIYTAILALHLDPNLWMRSASQNTTRAQDSNLLFRRSDLLDPDQSALFADLTQMPDPRLRVALRELAEACKLPVSQVRLSSIFNDPDYEKRAQLLQLEQAIQHNDEDEIVQAWTPLLDLYPPAQKYRAQLVRAQQIQQKLNTFRAALSRGLLQEIVDAFTPELDYSRHFTIEERDLLHQAQAFLTAYEHDHDQELFHASRDLLQLKNYTIRFTVQQQSRIDLAKQRMAALAVFRQGLSTKNIQLMLQAYSAQLLDQSEEVTPEERAILQAATTFSYYYNTEDDRAVLESYETIAQHYAHALKLTPHEEERVLMARQRLAAFKRFQQAFSRKIAFEITAAYIPLIDHIMTKDQQMCLELAYKFVLMYNNLMNCIASDDDLGIEAIYDEDLAAEFHDFTQAQTERIHKALRGRRLEQALQNEDYGQALRLVQEIEMVTRQQNTDPRISLARRKFIRQFEAQDVQGRRVNNEVVVSWRWPADEMIRHAVVVWRTDRWPQHPRNEEVGTSRERIFRAPREQTCLARFQATQYMAVYLQVYFVIPDYTRQPPVWFFSDGNDPGSRAAVYYSTSGYRI